MSTSTSSAGTQPVTTAAVEDILVRRTGVNPAILDGQRATALLDLGIDSLAVLELQAVVERQFGVTLPEDAGALSVTTITDLINTGHRGE
jgi:acyl carrier protein